MHGFYESVSRDDLEENFSWFLDQTIFKVFQGGTQPLFNKEKTT